MSKSQSPNSPAEYELDVEFSEVELFRELIQRIQLNGGIQRVSLQIESTEPLYQPASEATTTAEPPEPVEAESEPDSDSEPEEWACEIEECDRTFDSKTGRGVHMSRAHPTDDDDDATDDAQIACDVCGDTFESERGKNIHKGHRHGDDDEDESDASLGHLTDKLLGDDDTEERDEENDDDEDSVERGVEAFDPTKEYDADDAIRSELAVDYLEATDDRDGRPSLEWFEDHVESSLSPDTQRYNVLAVLYRTQGLLKATQIRAMLEDTDWEMSQSGVSTALTDGKNNGWAFNVDGGWQLTQYGRDYFDAIINETPGYDLQVADRVTGTREKDEKVAEVTA